MQIKTKIVSCHTGDSKPVKQEVNGTMILPPLVFLAISFTPPKVAKAGTSVLLLHVIVASVIVLTFANVKMA